MLVTGRDGILELITQTDHAAVAGVLAAAWGGERFAVPGPRNALLCAATAHDDGWIELDSIPAFNPAAGRPANFTELPLTQTAGPYGRGVDSVYARDPHAGALVSMHWSGFSTSRWGAGGGHASDDPLALEVVASQEARWMPALRQVWGNRGRRSEFDAATWHAYEVLQAVDLLSLGLGLMPLVTTARADQPVRVERTLGAIDQKPGPRSVTSVPTRAGGSTETLALCAQDEATVTIDPWPFAPGSLEVVLPARHIEDRVYASADESAAAFHSAEPYERRLRLVPATTQATTPPVRPAS